MTQADLTKLRAAHETFIAKRKASGGHTVTFSPPCCRAPMETPAPNQPVEDDEVWDTLSTCPACGSMFMKYVTHSGASGYIP